MKTIQIATALLTLAAITAGTASAQTLKPGLWEIRTTQGAPGSGKALADAMAKMRKEIAAMPAAQRKQMEAAMAANDANEVRFTNDGMTLKHCVTKEDAADMSKMVVKDANCTTERTPMVGGVVKMTMSCPALQMTGNGTIRFQGDSGYSMDMSTTAKYQGENRVSKMSSTGKWLSADCGKVKPAAAMGKPAAAPK